MGMITPALAQLVGGDRALALTLVVISSFAAPFYLPFFLKIVGGTVVELNTLRMMLNLGKLIFIPFIISLVVRKWTPGIIRKSIHLHPALSVILLFFVLAGVSARGGNYVRGNFETAALFLFLAVLFCSFLTGSGYFGFWFVDREKRLGLAVSVPYMNIALAIVIAAEYFSTRVLIFSIMYEVPINLLPVLVRRLRIRSDRLNDDLRSGTGTDD
jgi:BASS family bile acid:Na+ symporter